MSMRPQVSIKYGEKEENLSFIQQMGISYVSLGLDLEQVQIETIKSEQQRLLRYGLRVSDAYCMKLQKNRAIILGKDEAPSSNLGSSSQNPQNFGFWDFLLQKVALWGG